ncbi:MAG: hypothetical protein JWN91_2820 [Nocardioides sp.]|jgi:hypothetical protein|nr:hypothetical protein [Nocardioides sp.]
MNISMIRQFRTSRTGLAATGIGLVSTLVLVGAPAHAQRPAPYEGSSVTTTSQRGSCGPEDLVASRHDLLSAEWRMRFYR